MQNFLQCKFTIDEDAIDTRVGDETVILHMEQSIYFGLDGVGTRIWELLKSERDMSEILDALVAEYDEDRGVVEADLRAFLEEMHNMGLIRLS